MDTLCINNITIYPGIEPPKGMVYLEIKMELITLWISKCKNIFYISDNKHPISKYKLDNPEFILCYLIDEIAELVPVMDIKSMEFFIFNSFLSGAFDFIRYKSRNSFENSLDDPILTKIHTKFCLTVFSDSFKLSEANYHVKKIRKDHTLLKNNVMNILNDMSEMISNTNAKISSFKKITKEIGVQTDKIVENVWVNRKIIKTHNVEIQTCNKVKDTDTQTDITEEKLTEEKLTEEKQLVKLTEEKPKQSSKKKKEELIVFTEKEYAKMMLEHKKDIEKAKQDAYDKHAIEVAKVMMKKGTPIGEIYHLLNGSQMDNALDAVLLYSIRIITTKFLVNMHSSGRKNEKILGFMSFWKNVILKHIHRFAHPIFKTIFNEWNLLIHSIMKSGIPIEDVQLDMVFMFYTSAIIGENWEEQFFIPNFFNILIRRCRNLPVLIGLISIWDDKDRRERDGLLNDMLGDFFLLYTIPSELEILHENRDVIKYPDTATRKFYVYE